MNTSVEFNQNLWYNDFMNKGNKMAQVKMVAVTGSELNEFVDYTQAPETREARLLRQIIEYLETEKRNLQGQEFDEWDKGYSAGIRNAIDLISYKFRHVND